MRNMSFALTTEQIRDRSKTVTRRIGWRFLKRGDLVRAVVKSRGLKKDEKVEELAVIRIRAVSRELIQELVLDPRYGRRECRLEGFPTGEYSNPEHFVDWFCLSHKCNRNAIVTGDATLKVRVRARA
jgi:hypothetical protein